MRRHTFARNVWRISRYLVNGALDQMLPAHHGAEALALERKHGGRRVGRAPREVHEFGLKAARNVDLERLANVEHGEVARDGEFGVAPIVFEDYSAMICAIRVEWQTKCVNR